MIQAVQSTVDLKDLFHDYIRLLPSYALDGAGRDWFVRCTCNLQPFSGILRGRTHETALSLNRDLP